MKFFSKERRDVISAWCIAMSAGAFVGGVLFNSLGMGDKTM